MTEVAQETFPIEDFSRSPEELVSEEDYSEDTLEDPDDLPLLPPPPVPKLKDPIIIDLNDNETSSFLPKTESPFKSLSKTLSFLPSFMRPGTDTPPPNESSQDPSTQDLELQLESDGLENEPENSSINYEQQLNEENNIDNYYDEEPYPEDNGYVPEYVPDTPEPEVDNLEVNNEPFTRSKSVTFADDIENLENRSSVPFFSLFDSIQRRLSDTLKPILSHKENEQPIDSEPLENEILETDSTDMAVEEYEMENKHVLHEEEIEIHETNVDSSEVPMNVPSEMEEFPSEVEELTPEIEEPPPEIEEVPPEIEEVPPEIEEVPPELEETLEIENNQVELENNTETLDIETSGVGTLGEPLDSFNNDDTEAIEGDDTMVSEETESSEPASIKDSIPFSFGSFPSFRVPGVNNNVDEINEGDESPVNENSSFSFGRFSNFRISGSNSTNEIPEVNDGQEPPPENSSFSFGGLSSFKIPRLSSTNESSTSEPIDGQEPPVENAPFSFGISGFRDLVPTIPLPTFPNSEIIDEDVKEETERVSDGTEEPIAIPEVSVQEIQDEDIEHNTTPVIAGGLLASERFGQDDGEDTENKEALDKEEGEVIEAVAAQPLEDRPPTDQPPLDDDQVINGSTTEISEALTVPVDETEISPPIETEIPAEITAETPPMISVETTGTEERGFKKQTSSSDVPKRYTKNEMTKGSSSSLTSLYSAGGEAYGKIPITGDVQFGLSYNHKLTQFNINIGACRDLAPVDAKRNKSDPYVKVYLLPDKGRNGKRKTKIKKGTINPQFNEILRYKIKETELRTRTLSVAVWNNDKLGRNFFLGEVLLPLDDVHFDNYNAKWHQLLPKVLDDGGIIYKGDITLALKFECEGVEADQKEPKSTGALLIHFKNAKNLTAIRLNGSDPYAKCYLEPDRSKTGKRKTKHVRSNCNPTWDQQVQYGEVTIEDLKQRALHVTVWDKDTLSANDFLGVVCLSLGTGRVDGKEVNYMKSKGEEIRIWEEMLAKPNTWIEATIPLQAKL